MLVIMVLFEEHHILMKKLLHVGNLEINLLDNLLFNFIFLLNNKMIGGAHK
jgi:hypothetical protein